MQTAFAFFFGIITGVVGNYIYDQIKFKLRKKKSELLPKILDDSTSWKKDNDGYFYEKEPNFRIKINDGQDGLATRFKRFPDKNHDRISWVEVQFSNSCLHGCNFMYLDGYRYFVPVPKIEFSSSELTEDSFYDYYDLNSMEIQIFNIVGEASLTGEETRIDGLRKIAKILGILIIE